MGFSAITVYPIYSPILLEDYLIYFPVPSNPWHFPTASHPGDSLVLLSLRKYKWSKENFHQLPPLLLPYTCTRTHILCLPACCYIWSIHVKANPSTRAQKSTQRQLEDIPPVILLSGWLISISIQACVISGIISFPQHPPTAAPFTVNFLALNSKAPQKSCSNLLSPVLFLPLSLKLIPIRLASSPLHQNFSC